MSVLKMSAAFYKARAAFYGYGLKRVDRPRNVEISLTCKCNLRCCMCKNHMEDTPLSAANYKDMPEELFN